MTATELAATARRFMEGGPSGAGAGAGKGVDARHQAGEGTRAEARVAETFEFWPRAAALLARQALEQGLDDLWGARSPRGHGEPPEGVSVVHPAVAKDGASKEVLLRLGIKPLSVEMQLKQEIGKAQPDWGLFWELVRTMPQDKAVVFVRSHGSLVRIRNLEGQFLPARQLLLPGPMAQVDDAGDRRLIVDVEFHADDSALLRAAGAVDAPRDGFDVRQEDWFGRYDIEAKAAYRKVEVRGSLGGIVLLLGTTIGPLHALAHGSEGLREQMTRHLLQNLPTNARCLLSYSTRPHAYEKAEFIEPVRWCVAKYGRLPTSQGAQISGAAVGPALARWSRLLPVADGIDDVVARDLGMPTSLAELSGDHWESAFSRSHEITAVDDLDVVWAFCAEASSHTDPPSLLPAYGAGQIAHVAASELNVTDDRERFGALQLASIPSALVASRAQVDALVGNWGCAEAVATTRYEAAGDEEVLLDVLPGLEPHVTPRVAETTRLQPSARLWLEVERDGATYQTEVPFAKVGAHFYYQADAAPAELLDAVVRGLEITLSAQERAEVLAYLDREQRQRAVMRVRSASSVGAKLLAAIGVEAVTRWLPRKVVDAATQDTPARPAGDVLAEAAVAVFGVEVLSRYSTELRDAGFYPPHRWNGGRPALAFCEELGFPPEYAGFEIGRRDPMLEVDGPVELNPLHDFQEAVAERMRAFYLQDEPDRGLLSLPTGAGKTRVVVEAVIRAMKDRRERDLVIWIAQTDELCEQAVQAWSQAWRSIGPALRLRVSRLWGATNNLVRDTDDEHVVVCTYQSLGSRLPRSHYRWLQNARAVIIDEAHGSTAPSYTEILFHLGLTAQKSGRHLIGLTATPFRGSGFDEAETRWLANRYGQSRFDHGAMPDEDPYPYLQRKGILARVEHQVLEGRNLDLSSGELEHLKTYRVLPPTAEQRLGDDDRRNQMLVETISALDHGWPVLLFATSVNHAQLMAALLSLRGVEAKAVSGDTDVAARRHYISEFKAGRIRVLTNYGVLTTGFDAPSLRALVIARPVYSRALYQQMLGRGLRGPRNGGKEKCLVVNVADNVAQYGMRLAFREFEHLWQPWRHPLETGS